MSTTTNTPARVAIIADASNAVVPDALSAQLKGAPGINIAHVDSSLSQFSNAGEFVAQLRAGVPYQLVVASVGVPGDSTYQNRIHTLLDAWEVLPEKPVLLLATPEKIKALQFAHSWIAERPHMLPVSGAVGVNPHYLLESGREKVIEAINHSLQVAKELAGLLTSNNTPIPSPSVRSPQIICNAALSKQSQIA
ncbi:MAG: hypothetical protein SFT92_02170 [Rickettsiales bacterium]|nr:hypothetical protein [Rickettsiales bacterium]